MTNGSTIRDPRSSGDATCRRRSPGAVAWAATASALVAAITVQAEAAPPARTRTLTFDPATGQWVEPPPPLVGTAEAELHAIQASIREGRHRQALSAVKKFLKRNGPGEALHPDALIVKAEAQIGRGDPYKAHLTLQEFLAAYRGTALTAEATRLEFVVAETFLRGVKRKVWGIPMLSGEDTAIQILDEIAADDGDPRMAELALKTKADYLYDKGEHAPAEGEYARLARDYPLGRYHPFAMRRTADAALARFAGVGFDEVALGEAAARYTEYRARYPAAARQEGVDDILHGVDEARAGQEFAIASYYERTGYLRSAIFYYESVRRNWPQSIAGAKAEQRLKLLAPPLAPVSDSVASSEESSSSASR